MKGKRIGSIAWLILFMLAAALTMSGTRPRVTYRLVNVGGMDNRCQCTSRIEQ